MKSQFRGPVGHIGLRGRASECALLDDLVSAVRRGEGRSLVLRGEAGIGKTALLDYLIASASDLTLIRAVGVQLDMELPFASLHQLCGPLLDELPKLPAPQRQALEIVFGAPAGGERRDLTPSSVRFSSRHRPRVRPWSATGADDRYTGLRRGILLGARVSAHAGC
jgi:hypothetical protein